MTKKSILLFVAAVFVCKIGFSQNEDMQTKLNQSPPVKFESSLKSLLSDTISIPLDDKYIEGLASCDIDNDGKDELIVLTNYDGGTQIGQLLIFNWNNNEFELIYQSQEITGYPYGIQIADINNDNYNDILVSCSGVQLFLNNSGTISFYGEITTTTPDDLFLVADLNNDDKPDLGLGSPGVNSGYSVKLFKQESDYNFIFNSELDAPDSNNMVKSFDVDNNTDTDILTGELYHGEVNVFNNNQSFIFDKSFTYKFNTRIFSIETADFDNDNYDDFIIAEAWANVHFFQNKQDTFEIMYEGSNIGSAFQSKAIDINNDNLTDLIVAAFSGNIYLYMNEGNFQFEEISANIDYVDGNYGLAVGDFDNDGNIDMAYGKDPVYIAFNVKDVFGVNSINSSIFKKVVDIYPNPSSIDLNIDNLKIGTIISIYSLSGQKLKKTIANSKNIKMNIFDLADGVYIIKISEGNETYFEKVIKK